MNIAWPRKGGAQDGVYRWSAGDETGRDWVTLIGTLIDSTFFLHVSVQLCWSRFYLVDQSLSETLHTRSPRVYITLDVW